MRSPIRPNAQPEGRAVYPATYPRPNRSRSRTALAAHPVANGIGGGLDPVREGELLERVVDVVLHGPLGDRQLGRDLLVREARRDIPEYLRLAPGERHLSLPRLRGPEGARRPAPPECLEEAAGDRRRDRRLAPRREADPLEELLRLEVLQEIAVGAGLDRLEQVVVLVGDREHDDRQVDARTARLADALDATRDGHVHVHHDEVGYERPDLGHRLGPPAGP